MPRFAAYTVLLLLVQSSLQQPLEQHSVFAFTFFTVFPIPAYDVTDNIVIAIRLKNILFIIFLFEII